MAKKKIEEVDEVLKQPTECTCEKRAPILPITQEFGNGDLNVLRDKINEILELQ